MPSAGHMKTKFQREGGAESNSHQMADIEGDIYYDHKRLTSSANIVINMNKIVKLLALTDIKKSCITVKPCNK